MKSLVVIIAVLYAVVSQAEAACKKDACYNAIAVSTPGINPPLASRKADCSAVLRTVIDDDKTVTKTTYKTIFPETTTISSVVFTITDTITSTVSSTVIETVEDTFTSTSTTIAFTTLFGIPRKVRGFYQATALPSPESDEDGLEARDIIVVKGSRPSYATAACNDIKAYATACLCYGIKAAVYTNAPKVKTVTSTRTGTASVIVLISTTDSVTDTITSRATSFSTIFETSTTTTTTTTVTLMCGAKKRAIDLGSMVSGGFSNFYYGAMETPPPQLN